MGFYRGPQIVKDGLVFYLDGANSKSYSGTGTTWFGLINNNNGTLANNALYDQKNNGIFVFDGVNARVNTSFIYETFNSYTINVWIFRKSTKSFQTLLGGDRDNSISMGIRIDDANLLFHTNDSVDKILFDVPNILPLNKWVNITATVVYTTQPSSSTSGIVALYLNGNQVGTNTFSGVGTFERTLRIGSPTNNNLNRAFHGDISQVSIYNRDLSNQEIKQNYDTIKNRFNQIDAEQDVWNVLMFYVGKKTTTTLTSMGSPGTSTFMTMTEESTGANNRNSIGDGQGLYSPFFNKTNITKIAFVDGSSDSLDPTQHNNFLIYELVESTGSESINDILKRLDIYQRDSPSFHNNDSVWGNPSVLNHTAGTNGYSGLLINSGGTNFSAFTRSGVNRGLPDKFAIMGINRDSDNDIQALCAFWGNLQTGKGDAWRGTNPEETFWSYWGHDFHSSSTTQRIGSSSQTLPGIVTQSLYNGNVYMLAL